MIMRGESEVTMLQASMLVSSLVNPPPMFKKLFNNQDRYITYQKKQHCQDDRFFFADEYNIKRMVRISQFELWFERVYTQLLNILHELTYIESSNLKNVLVMYTKPNFRSHVLVSFDVKKKSHQLYIHKKTKLNIQNQNGTHVPRFVQLGFRMVHMIMFDALAAMPEDWTMFYEFVPTPKMLVISFDQSDDWKCLKDMHGRDFYSPDTQQMHTTVLAPSIQVHV
uniref:Uncharacterized protein n=1 Tax=Romanomermis culicivorax TaxID=13658 RepID=A0A915KL43_ROMCU